MVRGRSTSFPTTLTTHKTRRCFRDARRLLKLDRNPTHEIEIRNRR